MSADTLLLCLSLLPVSLIGVDLLQNIVRWQLLPERTGEQSADGIVDWVSWLDWIACALTWCKDALIVAVCLYLLSGAAASLRSTRRR